ncbi:MAG: isoprenylcysteine carboxylmethyltransferase family protein [Terriglobales bacterium]
MITQKLLHDLIGWPWIIFAIVWLVGALKTNRTRVRESFVSRYGVMLILIAGFVFIFNDSTKIGFLKLRFVPHNLAVDLLGVVLTWLGIALAIWARFYLGRNWSARVTIKEDHELIRTGPYAHLRHPIYSGLLLAMAGSALETGQWRGLVGLALVLIGFSLKALKEESMLGQQFGEKFQEHRKHTGFLLPRFR